MNQSSYSVIGFFITQKEVKAMSKVIIDLFFVLLSTLISFLLAAISVRLMKVADASGNVSISIIAIVVSVIGLIYSLILVVFFIYMLLGPVIQYLS